MEIVSCLRNGALKELFIEHLGWDRAQGQLSVELDGDRFDLEKVAQKRGFLVLSLMIDRPRGQTKSFVRRVQAHLSRVAHEHLLILQDEQSDFQVWAWAYRDEKNGRLRHRLHPLFTDCIPPKLVDRISRLSVSFDEEERITLFDVASRTKVVLDAEADQKTFFRRPAYAHRSHELAIMMRAGGKREFDDFVLFHQKLAGWFARRYKRLVNDQEDMVQEAIAGLIRSALKFDPEHGTAFSTYAFNGMRNECNRALPKLVPLGRVPDHVYCPFRRVMRRWARARSVGGEVAGLDERDQAIADEGLDESVAIDLYRVFHPCSLEDSCGRDWADRVGAVEYTQDYEGWGKYRTPLSDAALVEMNGVLKRAIQSLPERDGEIVLSRFGFHGERMTLQELGEKLALTRERVRQIENQALDRLKRWLLHEFPNNFTLTHSDSQEKHDLIDDKNDDMVF